MYEVQELTINMSKHALNAIRKKQNPSIVIKGTVIVPEDCSVLLQSPAPHKSYAWARATNCAFTIIGIGNEGVAKDCGFKNEKKMMERFGNNIRGEEIGVTVIGIRLV